jgi:hypothetical protein
MAGKRKTSIVTFRINQEYEKMLRKLAEEKKITLNTLANQIIGNYVDLHRYMEKFGTVVISKEGFETMLDALDEKELARIGASIGGKIPKEFILFRWKEVTAENFARFINVYFDHCGYGRSDIEITESTSSFSIRHDLGWKGSVFLRAFMHAAVQSTLSRSCEDVVSENSLIVRFRN